MQVSNKVETAPISTDRVRAQRVRHATLVMLVMLLVQFALGISSDLYATVAAHHPGAHPSDYFGGSLQSLAWALHHAPAVLAAHSALGLLILLAAIGLVVQTVRIRRSGLVAMAMMGAASVIGAGFNGLSFLDYSQNLNSLIMALLFALAMLCYLSIIYTTPAAP